MPTVAEVMNDVADAAGLNLPSAWTSVTSKTYRDVTRCLRQTVDDMQKRADWPNITNDYTVTGDGSSSYDLPEDFKRISRDPLAVYETGMRRACIPVIANGDWTYLTDVGNTAAVRYYRTTGSDSQGFEIEFFQAPDATNELIVSYVSRNWFVIGTTPGYEWMNETAELILPREVVFHGTLYRWRMSKGQPFLTNKTEYEKLIAQEANDSRNIRTISMGKKPTKKPWIIDVPDYVASIDT